MGQKTHPLGFRFGINAKSVELAYSNRDLHGLNARWAVNSSGNTHIYSSLSQKDNVIRTLIGNMLDEDDFVMNKCIIHRADSFVGIYVDAYEIEETTVKNKAILENKVVNTKDRENYISENVEKGTPVSIQFVQLRSKGRNSDNFNLEKENEGTSVLVGGETDVDLKKGLTRLFKENIPCCNLIAKLVSRKMTSSSRGERGTLRLLAKNIKTMFDPKEGVYGVKGYLVIVKGRISGSERSRIVRYRSGPMPRHTVSAAIDYGFAEVSTISGQISLTVMAYFSK